MFQTSSFQTFQLIHNCEYTYIHQFSRLPNTIHLPDLKNFFLLADKAMPVPGVDSSVPSLPCVVGVPTGVPDGVPGKDVHKEENKLSENSSIDWKQKEIDKKIRVWVNFNGSFSCMNKGAFLLFYFLWCYTLTLYEISPLLVYLLFYNLNIVFHYLLHEF